MNDSSEDTTTVTSIQFSVASSHAGGGVGRSSSTGKGATTTAAAAAAASRTAPPLNAQATKRRLALGSSAAPTASSLPSRSRHPPLSPQAVNAVSSTSSPPLPGLRAALATPPPSASSSLVEAPAVGHGSWSASPSDASLLFVRAVAKLNVPHPNSSGESQHPPSQQEGDASSSDEAVRGHRDHQHRTPYESGGLHMAEEEEGIRNKSARMNVTSHSVTSSRGSIDFQEEEAEQQVAAVPAMASPPIVAATAATPPATLHVGGKPWTLKGTNAHGSSGATPPHKQKQQQQPSSSLSTSPRSISPGKLVPVKTAAVLAPSKAMRSKVVELAATTPSPSPPSTPVSRKMLYTTGTTSVRPRTVVTTNTATGLSCAAPARGTSASHIPSPRYDPSSPHVPLIPAVAVDEQAPQQQQHSDEDEDRSPPSPPPQRRYDSGPHHIRTPSTSSPGSPPTSSMASGGNFARMPAAAYAVAAAPLSLGQSSSVQQHRRVSSVSVPNEDDPVYCTVSEMTNAASMRGGTYSMLPIGAMGVGAAETFMSSHRPSLVPSASAAAAAAAAAAVASRRVQSFDMSLDESNPMLSIITPKHGTGHVMGGSGQTTAAALSPSPKHQDLHHVMPLPTFTALSSGQQPTAEGGQTAAGTDKAAAAEARSITTAPTAETASIQTRESSIASPRPPDTITNVNPTNAQQGLNNVAKKPKKASPRPAASSGPPEARDTRVVEETEEEPAQLPRRRSSFSAALNALGGKSLLCRTKSGSTASKSGAEDNEGSTPSLRSRQSTSHSIAAGLSRLSSRLKRGVRKVISARRPSDDVTSQQQQDQGTDAASDVQLGVGTAASTVVTLVPTDLATTTVDDSATLRGRNNAVPLPSARLPTARSTPTRDNQSTSVDASIAFHTDAEDTKTTRLGHEGQGGQTHTMANAPDPMTRPEAAAAAAAALILSRPAEEEVRDAANADGSNGSKGGATRREDKTQRRKRRRHGHRSSHRRRHHHRHHNRSASSPSSSDSAHASDTRSASSGSSFASSSTAASTTSLTSSEVRRQKDKERRRRRRHRRERREKHRRDARRRASDVTEGEGSEDAPTENDSGGVHRDANRKRKPRRHRAAFSSTSVASAREGEGQGKHRSCRRGGARQLGKTDEEYASSVHRRHRTRSPAPSQQNSKTPIGGDAKRKGEEEEEEEAEMPPAAVHAARRRAMLAASRVHSTVNHFRAAWQTQQKNRHRLWQQQYDAFKDRQRALRQFEMERKLRSQEAAINAAVATAASRSASRPRAVHDAHNGAVRRPQTPIAAAGRLDLNEAALTSDIATLDAVMEKMRRHQLWAETSPSAVAAATAAGSASTRPGEGILPHTPTSSRQHEESTPSATEMKGAAVENSQPPVMAGYSVDDRHAGVRKVRRSPLKRPATAQRAVSPPSSSAGPHALRTPTLIAGPLSSSSWAISAYADLLRRPSRKKAGREGHSVTRGGSSPAPRKPPSTFFADTPSVSASSPPPAFAEQRAAHQDTKPSITVISNTNTTTTAALQRRYEGLLEDMMAQLEGEETLSAEAGRRSSNPASSSVSPRDRHSNNSSSSQRLHRSSEFAEGGARGGLPVTQVPAEATRRRYRNTLSTSYASASKADAKRGEEEEEEVWRCAAALRAEYYEPSRTTTTVAEIQLEPQQRQQRVHVRSGKSLPEDDDEEGDSDDAAVHEQIELSYAQALRPSCTVCCPQRFEEYVTLGLLSMLHDTGHDATDAVNGRSAATAVQPPSTLLQRRIREDLYAPPKCSPRHHAGARRATQSHVGYKSTRKSQASASTAMEPPKKSNAALPLASAVSPAAIKAALMAPSPQSHPFTPSLPAIFLSLRIRLSRTERHDRRVLVVAEDAAVQALHRQYIIETICVLRTLRAQEEAAEEEAGPQQQAQQQQTPSPHSLDSSQRHPDGGYPGHEPATPAMPLSPSPPQASVARHTASTSPVGEGDSSDRQHPPSARPWRECESSSDGAERDSSDCTISPDDDHRGRRRADRFTDDDDDEGGEGSSDDSTDHHYSNNPSARSYGGTKTPPSLAERLNDDDDDDDGNDDRHDQRQPSAESAGPPAMVRRAVQRDLSPLHNVSAVRPTVRSRSPLSFSDDGAAFALGSGGGASSDHRSCDPTMVPTQPGSPERVLPVMPAPMESLAEEEEGEGRRAATKESNSSAAATPAPMTAAAAASISSDVHRDVEDGEKQHGNSDDARKQRPDGADDVPPASALDNDNDNDEDDSRAGQTAVVTRSAEEGSEAPLLPNNTVEESSASSASANGTPSNPSRSAVAETSKGDEVRGSQLPPFEYPIDDDSDDGGGRVSTQESSTVAHAASQDTHQETHNEPGKTESLRAPASPLSSSATAPQAIKKLSIITETEVGEQRSSGSGGSGSGSDAAEPSRAPAPSTLGTKSAVLALSINREDASDASGDERALQGSRHATAKDSPAVGTLMEAGDTTQAKGDAVQLPPSASTSSPFFQHSDAGGGQQQQRQAAGKINSNDVVDSRDDTEAEDDDEGERFEVHPGVSEVHHGATTTAVSQVSDVAGSDAAATIVLASPTRVDTDLITTTAGEEGVPGHTPTNAGGEQKEKKSAVAFAEAAAHEAEEEAPQQEQQPSLRRRVRFSLPAEHAPEHRDLDDDDKREGEEPGEDEAGAKGGAGARSGGGGGDDAEGVHETAEANSAEAITPEKPARGSTPQPAQRTTKGKNGAGDDEDAEDSLSEAAAVDLLEKLNGLDALLLYKFPTYFTTGVDSDGLPGAVMRRERDAYTPTRAAGQAAALRLSPGSSRRSASFTSSPADVLLVAGDGGQGNGGRGSPAAATSAAAAVTPSARTTEVSEDDEDDELTAGVHCRSGPQPDTAAAVPSPGTSFFASAPPPPPSHLASPQLPTESLATQMRRKYGLRPAPRAPPSSFRKASLYDSTNSTPSMHSTTTAAAAPSASPASHHLLLLQGRPTRAVPTLPSPLSAYTAAATPSNTTDRRAQQESAPGPHAPKAEPPAGKSRVLTTTARATEAMKMRTPRTTQSPTTQRVADAAVAKTQDQPQPSRTAP
ncbi:hypothetical protein ABB37_04269 [Leptomonas pyrrhocoris]|uniref:Uncharacterized protein n=1 Tax=Leptomonas pyrrhocoris TaxID=157538 RepID=A0A0M9G2J6_LEPPY|nr:hypothetical protein ABB37_04269 [Leptomonas pyrrhocoris]KPA80846.1 hypothetical protein ABB37_04269 [Leptomonas pyrrhocoris]|eukprot:XP_015659285.1 hypothetical protein ABB37_04269 [Leptomonas pyrrhocoris]